MSCIPERFTTEPALLGCVAVEFDVIPKRGFFVKRLRALAALVHTLIYTCRNVFVQLPFVREHRTTPRALVGLQTATAPAALHVALEGLFTPETFTTRVTLPRLSPVCLQVLHQSRAQIV